MLSLKPALIRISAISYLNSLPFAWCLEHSDLIERMTLVYDIPAQCADKLLNDEADIGLIPIVETLRMPEHHIVSDLCIGANGAVRTVLLASNTPIENISSIYLDCHSRTSAALAKVLARHYWKIIPEWIPYTGNITTCAQHRGSAAVIIGDKAFGVRATFVYDLAVEWCRFSGLPFVFACWVANKPINSNFIEKFNRALTGVSANIKTIAVHYKEKAPAGVDLLDYWTNNISYPLTADKRKGLELFLQLAADFI